MTCIQRPSFRRALFVFGDTGLHKKKTILDIQKMKADGERITVLTSYDFPLTRIMDACGIDVILVGDSLGVVVAGHDNTLPVTMEEMIYHTRAVMRAQPKALVVADMPFLSYQVDIASARLNAGRLTSVRSRKQRTKKYSEPNTSQATLKSKSPQTIPANIMYM